LDVSDVELRVEVCGSGLEGLLGVVESCSVCGNAAFVFGSEIPSSS
jgi:hypothetical protein